MPTFTVEITPAEIAGLLCSAFEGGIRYWCSSTSTILPSGVHFADFAPGGKHSIPGHKYFGVRDLAPLVLGCAVILRDREEERDIRLDCAAIERGIKIMKEKYPAHFGNWMSNKEDAETGDVFVQCCVFGEIVYG